jgi:adhesin transport system outer membrane protein
VLGAVLVGTFLLPVPLSASEFTLDEVLGALGQTAGAEVAAAMTGIARAELNESRSQKSPNLTVDAQGDLVGGEDPSQSEYVLRIEQTLFDWGRADEAIAGRRAVMGARESGEGEALLDAALRSTEMFYGIGAVNEKLASNRTNRHALTELRDMIQRRVESNVSPRIDLEEVKIRLDLLDIADHQLAAEKRRQQLSLRRLTGLDVESPVLSGCPAQRTTDEDRLIRDALASSPTLGRIRRQAEAHSYDARALDASGLPSLIAGYRSDSGLDGDGFDQRAYLALRYQFQAGGGLEARVAAERARYLEQQALLRKEAEVITQTVSAWVSAYQTSQALVGVYDRIMTSKRRQKESHLRRFLAGRSSWQDVLNTQREIADAQISQIDSQISACLASSSLDLLALGGGVLGD